MHLDGEEHTVGVGGIASAPHGEGAGLEYEERRYRDPRSATVRADRAQLTSHLRVNQTPGPDV